MRRKKFAVLETKRGVEVAETGRFAKALQENQARNCKELQAIIIEYMKDKRSGLETMERKQKLRIGAPEEVQTSIFQILDVEHELHGAKEELRTLTMEWRKTEAKGRG